MIIITKIFKPGMITMPPSIANKIFKVGDLIEFEIISVE